MFAGHIGAGLAIARADRRVPAGWFVAAALLLDVILWALVPAGLESVDIPTDYIYTHQPTFVFPYSHSLVAAVVWSVLSGLLAGLIARRTLPAVLIAAAVFSHWVLDVLVHARELPVAGANSARLGLALWGSNMAVALAVEAALTLGGLYLYLRGSGLPRGRQIGLSLLVVLVLVATIVGMTAAPRPPSVLAMAAGSLANLLIVIALTFWLARPAGPSAALPSA